MNVEVLMEAINGINEKYIIEARKIKKALWFKKHIWKAACVILAVIAVIFVWNVPERYEVIWAERLNVEELNEAVNNSKKGVLTITRSLYDATERSSQTDIGEEKTTPKKYLIAILVTETTGATKEEVYKKFVKPLTKNEDYLEKGVIYLTTEELMKASCPNDYALVLTLAEGDLK